MLTSFSLKLIALFLMVIDHIGMYIIEPHWGDEGTLYYILRAIGRISAPIFLFVLAEGLKHTRNKRKFTLRLYIASVIMGLGNIICTFIAGNPEDHPLTANIFANFFWVALSVIIIEKYVDYIRQQTQMNEIRNRNGIYTERIRNITKITIYLLIGICTFVFVSLFLGCFTAIGFVVNETTGRIINALLPSPLLVNYSPIFVALGIAWYFLSDIRKQIAIFLVLAILTLIFNNQIPEESDISAFKGMFADQYWMVFAIPFILFYNGERGRSTKWIFYIFYPIHIWIFYLVGML